MLILPQHIKRFVTLCFHQSKLRALITTQLLLALILLPGCSSIQFENTEDFDWNGVSTIALSEPAEDRWQLRPLIKKELVTMGFKIASETDEPHLLIGYTTQGKPDLNTDSQVIMRLKSLHITFKEPSSNNSVATLDYSYPPTGDSDPATGVKEAFAAIKKDLHSPRTQPPPGDVQYPPPAHTKSQTLKESSTTEKNLEPKEPRPKAQEKEPKPLETQSPWLPKLKSWGFENWGQSGNDSY